MKDVERSTGLRRIAELQDRALDVEREERRRRAEARFLASLGGQRPRLSVLWWAALALPLTAALLLWLRPSGALTAHTDEGTPIEAGAALTATDEGPLGINVSEGSRIRLEARARADVIALDSGVATVRLREGVGHMRITPGRGVRWRFLAGPFDVEVTGTAFRLQWAPSAQQFSIALHEGAVKVEGPLLQGGRRVEKGETLLVDLSEGRASFQAEGPRPTTEPEAPRPSAASRPRRSPGRKATPVPALPGEAASGAPEPNRDSWLALADAGRFSDSIDAAAAEGFDHLCSTLARPQLMKLADVARAAKRESFAASTYTCLRRRFPRGPDAALSAYMLGRIESEIHGNAADAAHWFQTYLDEEPKGALAAAALGRLIEALHQEGKESAARHHAARYLQMHPQGPHASLARRLLAGEAP